MLLSSISNLGMTNDFPCADEISIATSDASAAERFLLSFIVAIIVSLED
jgi:hypothetical protein